MEVVFMPLKQKNFLLILHEKNGSWLNRKKDPRHFCSSNSIIFIIIIIYEIAHGDLTIKFVLCCIALYSLLSGKSSLYRGGKMFFSFKIQKKESHIHTYLRP